jgi:uncharacterized protein (TIGR03435 family)
MTESLGRWVAAALCAGVGFGQGGAQARFEVASVKRGGDVFSTRPERSTGRIRWTTQLAYLIGYAYRLDFSRVTCDKCGSVYTLQATFDPSSTEEQVREMMQALLAERFRMRSHRVTTEVEGYGLSIGKGGPKVQEAGADGESYVAATMPEAGVVAVTGRRATIAQLAENLQRSTGVPVWDRTGLTGLYDFTFRYARESSADLDTDAPSLGAALQQGLGLRMEKRRGPVETLVVDQIEEPSGNE